MCSCCTGIRGVSANIGAVENVVGSGSGGSGGGVSTGAVVHFAIIGKLSVVVCRSEEHTSELQSRLHLVCRLLLEKKNKRQLCNN